MNHKNASIIIVDDESMIVEQLKLFLGDLGFQVTGYTDSVQAREVLKKQRFDILMTDLKMPNVSGMDLVKVITDRKLDTRVIIFTGFATTESAIDAIKYGVYRYVSKPYNLAEVKDIVTNAVKILYLERENAALNKKVQNMYAYITTLYDIVTILYQVSEFSLAIDMVLDTLTEAMKTPKVGFFLPDETGAEFSLKYYKGVTAEVADKLRLRIGDRVNNQIVDGLQTVILQPQNHRLSINGDDTLYPKEIDTFILIPLRYHEKTIGFLAVFEIEKDDFSLEDKAKLLEILATQAAPVLSAQYQCDEKMAPTSALMDVVENIINRKILTVKEIHASMAIALIRFVPGVMDDEIPIISKVKKLIQQKVAAIVPPDVEIIWQNYDSFILIQSRSNVVDMEILAVRIQQELEQSMVAEEYKFPGKIIYSVGAYPFDGKSAAELLNELTHRIVERYGSLIKSGS